MAQGGANHHRWWKEAVIYQVWPASFCDSNGDGWGDVNGITSKLDHIKNLGVDIVWVSPIYKSPQVDMGYDIADYKDIDPKYGTLADVDNLIKELKKRDMKLMMDLVVNHTSDQHEWFKQSRSSREDPKRSWYIWKPAKYDEHGNRQPPNNWSMILGEENSAWSWDEKTQEYYLALFTPEQPDLNWEKPDVREAVHDVMRFWLDRGCCGFRMDVINHISKHQSFPNAPIMVPDHKYQPGFPFYANGPRLHEWLKDINRQVLSKYDTITVGEMPFVDDDKEILKVVGAEEEELSMIFIFALCGIDDESYRMTLRKWVPKDIKRIVARWQTYMIKNNGWNSVFLENHDNGRSVSRYTDDSEQWREIGCKLLALMMTTLSGTLYIYQGQEIGMKNFPLSWPVQDYKDVESQNYWRKMTTMYPNDKSKHAHAREVLHRKARDHARNPVQWSTAPHAGFCPPSATPWMRVFTDDAHACNVAAQSSATDPDHLTVLQFWRRGLANRKKHKEAFVYGGFELVDAEHESLFAYLRTSGDGKEKFLVVLNFTGEEVAWTVPGDVRLQSWVAGNYVAGKPETKTQGEIVVRPWEGLLGVCG